MVKAIPQDSVAGTRSGQGAKDKRAGDEKRLAAPASTKEQVVGFASAHQLNRLFLFGCQFQCLTTFVLSTV